MQTPAVLRRSPRKKLHLNESDSTPYRSPISLQETYQQSTEEISELSCQSSQIIQTPVVLLRSPRKKLHLNESDSTPYRSPISLQETYQQSTEEISELSCQSSQIIQTPVVLRRSPRKKLHLNESDSTPYRSPISLQETYQQSTEEISELSCSESSQIIQTPAVLRRSPRKKLHLNESDSTPYRSPISLQESYQQSTEEISELSCSESSQIMQTPVVLRRSPRKKLHLNESDSTPYRSPISLQETYQQSTEEISELSWSESSQIIQTPAVLRSSPRKKLHLDESDSTPYRSPISLQETYQQSTEEISELSCSESRQIMQTPAVLRRSQRKKLHLNESDSTP